MGKERDKLLWSLGKKPNTLTNEEAHKEYMTRRIAEGNPPPRMKKILEEIAEEYAKKTRIMNNPPLLPENMA